MCAKLQTNQNLFKVTPIKFTDIVRNEHTEMLDQYYAVNGWQLERWENATTSGYHIFFGRGVQVDGHFEYQFPYLLDKDELLDAIDQWQIDSIEKYPGVIVHDAQANEA